MYLSGNSKVVSEIYPIIYENNNFLFLKITLLLKLNQNSLKDWAKISSIPHFWASGTIVIFKKHQCQVCNQTLTLVLVWCSWFIGVTLLLLTFTTKPSVSFLGDLSKVRVFSLSLRFSISILSISISISIRGLLQLRSLVIQSLFAC